MQTAEQHAEYINQLRARGESIGAAAVNGSVQRLRPIMMTMLVASIGLLPAATSHGIGSDSQRPFAIVIVGGLAALILSIFLLPTFIWLAGEHDAAAAGAGNRMTREQVCAHIAEAGIIPAIRVPSAEDARFAVTTLAAGGLSLMELTMTVPGALGLLSELTRTHTKLILGAGSIRDVETAVRCVDAGAAFLFSPGLIPAIVEFAVKHKVAVIPGALTPTEVLTAMQEGADFVKVFPCSQVGGPSYIKALKAPFPDARLIASGGVSQVTATDFIHAGAAAIGLRQSLIPPDAIADRNTDWIHELALRFQRIVKQARQDVAAARVPTPSVE